VRPRDVDAALSLGPGVAGQRDSQVSDRLHVIALNQRLALWPSLWSRQGSAELQALVRLPHTRRRRDDSLELLQWLNGHIDELDLLVATGGRRPSRPPSHDALGRRAAHGAGDGVGARSRRALP